MKRQYLALVLVVLSLSAVAMGLVCSADLPGPAWAAALDAEPTIIEVDPSSAPNDLDTPIVITGTNFEDGADVLLDGTSLEDVSWAGDTRLEATVPWGLDPGVYALNVANPGGGSATLAEAFTVTQGIGVWHVARFYGGSIKPVVVNPVTPATVYAYSAPGTAARTGRSSLPPMQTTWPSIPSPRPRSTGVTDSGSLVRTMRWIPGIGLGSRRASPTHTLPSPRPSTPPTRRAAVCGNRRTAARRG
jgi:hypothetical protein